MDPPWRSILPPPPQKTTRSREEKEEEAAPEDEDRDQEPPPIEEGGTTTTEKVLRKYHLLWEKDTLNTFFPPLTAAELGAKVNQKHLKEEREGTALRDLLIAGEAKDRKERMAKMPN